MSEKKSYRLKVIIDTAPIEGEEVELIVRKILLSADPQRTIIKRLRITGSYDILPGDQHRHEF